MVLLLARKNIFPRHFLRIKLIFVIKGACLLQTRRQLCDDFQLAHEVQLEIMRQEMDVAVSLIIDY